MWGLCWMCGMQVPLALSRAQLLRELAACCWYAAPCCPCCVLCHVAKDVCVHARSAGVQCHGRAAGVPPVKGCADTRVVPLEVAEILIVVCPSGKGLRPCHNIYR